MVQNLRATLDYLIGELRSEGPTGSSQFPICATPESFVSARRSKLSGVPAAAIATIERMQAYGPDPDRGALEQWSEELQQRELYRPLRWLQTLWNVDKHRALAVASGLVVPGWASHNRVGEDSGIGFRIDRSKGQAEVWVPLDERDDFLDAHFDVSVSLRPPPRGYKADWPTEINAFELDGLAESLCWMVRWSVLGDLEQYRVA